MRDEKPINPLLKAFVFRVCGMVPRTRNALFAQSCAEGIWAKGVMWSGSKEPRSTPYGLSRGFIGGEGWGDSVDPGAHSMD